MSGFIIGILIHKKPCILKIDIVKYKHTFEEKKGKQNARYHKRIKRKTI